LKTPEECESIEEVRRSIDALDREVIARIGLRARYVEAAARTPENDARRATPVGRRGGVEP
jgi:isochorismate pyruvate lyase